MSKNTLNSDEADTGGAEGVLGEAGRKREHEINRMAQEGVS